MLQFLTNQLNNDIITSKSHHTTRKDHTVTNRLRPIVEQGSLLFDMETKG